MLKIMILIVKQLLLGDKYYKNILLKGKNIIDIIYLTTSSMVKFFSDFNYVVKI